MKLLIVSYGTEGDVRPLAVLARRWMQAGHEALLLADESTLGFAWQANVPCAPLSGDIGSDAGGIANVVTSGQRRGDMTRALAAIANAQARQWLGEIIAAGRDADLILASGLAVFSGLSAAEYLNLPVVGASFIPFTPTRSFASPFLPPARWNGLLNRASHHLVNGLVWQSMRAACNRARSEVAGLPARIRSWTSHPVLYGISPTLLPRPGDWPAHVHLCGQWSPVTAAWRPSPALATFLDNGPAPLYVGFGSMRGFDRAAVWRAVFTALDGRRALVSPGWSDFDGVDVPDNVHVVGDLPHDALFPHVSAVVHHGGSGTSHSATRAGRPSVTVAFAGDQAFWGARLCALGVAAPALSGHRLDAGALARAIAVAEAEATRRRAVELGEQMRTEDGTGTALALLERHASAPRAAAA